VLLLDGRGYEERNSEEIGKPALRAKSLSPPHQPNLVLAKVTPYPFFRKPPATSTCAYSFTWFLSEENFNFMAYSSLRVRFVVL
jgi:hypothetical protein